MTPQQFLDRLRAHDAHAPALICAPGAPGAPGAHGALSYGRLLAEVDALALLLAQRGVRVLASQLDNGAAWAVTDLAALAAGIVHVPLPAFFTPSMRAHALHASGADALLTAVTGADATLHVADAPLALTPLAAAPVALPAGTAKITFTSGSTGTPKGVCLSTAAQLAVADGLAQALAPLAIERHLCALPLPVLLENIAGLYAPLLAGAAVVLLPLARIGLAGASGFDPAALQSAVDEQRVDSVITLPQMLRAWSAWRAATAVGRDRLKLVAVGGARVGAALLAQARAAGLPAYEGYGLSEGASVQTLNLPGADRAGSAGRPLPHARLRIAADGEIEIAGSLMLGYTGSAERVAADGWWPTGDLGALDDAGFLHVQGRKKNLLITAFGRNVSPEWVESALQAQRAVAHAVVLGDGEPALWALLWPTQPTLPEVEHEVALAAAVDAANRELPDYARIAGWVRAPWPLTTAEGLATANGRPLRAAIEHRARGLPRAARGDRAHPPLVPLVPLVPPVATTLPSSPSAA